MPPLHVTHVQCVLLRTKCSAGMCVLHGFGEMWHKLVQIGTCCVSCHISDMMEGLRCDACMAWDAEND